MALLSTHQRPVSKSFDNLFNEFFATQSQYPQTKGQLPSTNIYETKDGYLLEMMAPGRNKANFKLSMEKGILTVGYETSEKLKQEDTKALRQEFNLPSFKRSFHVDESIDTEKIEARYENGLLILTLPKKAVKEETGKIINII